MHAQGLVAAQDGRRLWGPLDWQVAEGEGWHVQGTNGCGKTTLLRMLAGLRSPEAGRCGCAVPFWFIGHQPPWAEALSPLVQLEAWLGMAGARPAGGLAALRADLQAAGVPADRPVRQLSAGQRRRAALRVLALAPRPLWLLDEPFDGLDAAAAQALACDIAAQVATGGAVVFTAHAALPPGLRVLELPLGRTQPLAAGADDASPAVARLTASRASTGVAA